MAGYIDSKIPFEVDIDRYLSTPLLWNDFQQRITTLTDGMKLVLTQSSTALYLMDLAVEIDLTDDQASELARIIRDLLLSKVYLGDLPSAIQNQLNLDPTKAREVCNKLVAELLAPIMPDIKAAQLVHFRERIARQQVQAPPRPQVPAQTQATEEDNTLDLRKNS